MATVEELTAKKRRPWEEKRAQERQPRPGELTLYHGRDEGFTAQIGAYLTPSWDAAWQYTHRRSHSGVVDTVLLDVTGLVVKEVD